LTRRFTFGKREKLTSKLIFDDAFERGISVKAYPILARLICTPLPEKIPLQVAVNVSKRRFKRAVDRNRIKRLMREAWRHQKHAVEELVKSQAEGTNQWAVVFIFVGSELPSQDLCNRKMEKAIRRILPLIEPESHDA
jgi:ribonuclease P protein component